MLRRTEALNPCTVRVADMNLAARVVVLKELPSGDKRNGILSVVESSNGHALRINVVCKRLVADLGK